MTSIAYFTVCQLMQHNPSVVSRPFPCIAVIEWSWSAQAACQTNQWTMHINYPLANQNRSSKPLFIPRGVHPYLRETTLSLRVYQTAMQARKRCSASVVLELSHRLRLWLNTKTTEAQHPSPHNAIVAETELETGRFSRRSRQSNYIRTVITI